MYPLFTKRTVPIEDKNLYELPYADSHLIYKDKPGTALLIHSLVQLVQPNVCVIIGTGSGVIPRIIRESQISSGKIHGKTYLIDVGHSMGAMPDLIHNSSSSFRQCYPDIEVYKNYSVPSGYNWLKEKTSSIDILFIDGDHTYDGSLNDFNFFSTLVSENGIIFMHDTFSMFESFGVDKTIENIRYNPHFELINFTNFGSGLAIIKRKPKV